MAEYIGKSSKIEKHIYVIGMVLLVLVFVSIPFIAADKDKRQQQSWQSIGCRMYDNEKIDSIPAKCHGEFIDHYNPQELRSQPNE